jgi:23S rRNA G2069 N7-methylase RlmK/C1962 C5-methylase RlmI
MVLLALSEYAASVAGPGRTARKLFVEDAAQGFALVDLSTKRFDVVVMNPPFGAGSMAAKSKFESSYPRSKVDVYAAFVERGIELLQEGGRLGAITSRTGFYLSDFAKWRQEVILKMAPPVVFADLGAGVLDGAMVETAAYCLEAPR